MLNSAPLPKSYTRKDLDKLEKVWCSRLKDSGFRDVEFWKPLHVIKDQKEVCIQFRHSLSRKRRTQEQIKMSEDSLAQGIEYFSLLSTWAYNDPDIDVRFRPMILEYLQTRNIKEACKNTRNSVPYYAAKKYLSSSKPEMLAFVRAWEESQYD